MGLRQCRAERALEAARTIEGRDRDADGRWHGAQSTGLLPVRCRRPRATATAIATSEKIQQLKERAFVVKERAFFMGTLLLRRDSKFVTSYLKGLKGIEIGAASHNNYRLDAINVDRYAEADTIYKEQERRLVMRAAKVDVVAPGDDLPFPDDSHDFVFSSHVLEHIPDPIRALLEWQRVARRYVVCVIPHKERTFDADRPLTTTGELLERHRAGLHSEEDKHWSVWTCDSFLEMCEEVGFKVVDHLDPDDKFRNGFIVTIDASVTPPPIAAAPGA